MVWRISKWHHLRRGCWRDCVVQCGNRPQYLAAMAPQDAQLFEVLVRQVTKNVSIDCVLAKGGLVPLEAEAPKPTPQVHDRALSPTHMMVQLKQRV